MEYVDVKYHKQVRRKLIGELGVVFPEIPQLLISHYLKKCKEFGRSYLHFKVDELPKSLNHQWRINRGRKLSFRLDPQVLQFRSRVSEALGQARWQFKSTGAFAAVILLESKLWVTTKCKVRQMDADNRVKGVLDAVEHAMELPDELAWSIHVFKIASKRERTTVYLFDLGDLIEFYY